MVALFVVVCWLMSFDVCRLSFVACCLMGCGDSVRFVEVVLFVLFVVDCGLFVWWLFGGC